MKKIAFHLFIISGYIFLTILMTFPLVHYFNSAVAGIGYIKGENSDLGFFLWNLWQVNKSLVNHTGLFFTYDILYPLGCNLIFHSYTLLHGIIAFLLFKLFSFTATVNLITFFTFIASGYGTFLLIDYVIKDKAAAFIGGCIFAFCPYRMAHLLGHYDLVSTEWIPFCILFIIKAVSEEKKYLNAVFAATFLFLTTLSAYYYTLYLVMFSFLYLFYFTASGPRKIINLDIFKKISLFAAVAIILHIPFIYMANRVQATGENLTMPGWGGAGYYSADLFAFVIPPYLHPFFGKFALAFAKNIITDKSEWVVFTGYLTLLTSVASIIIISKKGERRIGFWVFLALVFFILSLGPFLKINGVQDWRPLGFKFYIPLPYLLLVKLPILNNLRVPSRFDIMFMLCLSVLAAYFIKRLVFNNITSRRYKSYAFTLFLFLFIFEYMCIPYPLCSTKIPDAYKKIASERNDLTVLEIPLSIRDSFRILGTENTEILYYQTFHNKRVVGGFLSRIPEWKWEYYTKAPILKEIFASDRSGSDFDYSYLNPEKDRKSALKIASFFNIGYIVMHKDSISLALYNYIRDVFGEFSSILYEDEKTLILKIKKNTTNSSFTLNFTPDDLDLYNMKGIQIMPMDILKIKKDMLAANTLPKEKAAVSISKESRIMLRLDPNHGYNIKAKFFSLPVGGLAARNSIKIIFNGRLVKNEIVNPGWNEISFTVPKESIKEGVNLLLFGYSQTKALSVARPMFSDLYIRAESSGYRSDASSITVGRKKFNIMKRGIFILAVDSGNGNVIKANVFDVDLSEKVTSRFVSFIKDIKEGDIVIGVVKDDASLNFNAAAQEAIKSIGGLVNLGTKFRFSYAVLGRKGLKPGNAIEELSPYGPASIEIGGPKKTNQLSVIFDKIEVQAIDE